MPWASVLCSPCRDLVQTHIFFTGLMSSWLNATGKEGSLGRKSLVKELRPVSGSAGPGPLHMVRGLSHPIGTVPSPTEMLALRRAPFSGWVPIQSVILVLKSGHTAPVTWLVPQNKTEEGSPLTLLPSYLKHQGRLHQR